MKLLICAIMMTLSGCSLLKKEDSVVPDVSYSSTEDAGTGPTLQVPEIPPEKAIGPITIHVRQIGLSSIVTMADGTVYRTNQYGQPISHGLPFAMMKAKPGDVIGLTGGPFKGPAIGRYDPNKQYAVFKTDGTAYKDVAVVSEDPTKKVVVEGVSFWGDARAPGGFGAANLVFKNIIFKNDPASLYNILVAYGSFVGSLYFYDIDFDSYDYTAFAGNGVKTNVRFHGRVAGPDVNFDFRRIKAKKAQEHMFYIDAPGGWGWDSGKSYIIGASQDGGSGRTAVQIVNRRFPEEYGGPTGTGDIVIKDCDFYGAVGGNGGSSITVAGHLGNVFVLDTTVHTDMGGIVFTTDWGKGAWLNEKGYSTNGLYLKNFKLYAIGADRPHVAIAGTEKVEIVEPFLIQGNKTAFDLVNEYSGGLKNGSVKFYVPNPVSQYQGFKSHDKVRLFGTGLSDQQIDRMGGY